MNLQRRKPLFAKPYSQLAYIYDYVMRHVDYENWAGYLNRIFKKADRDIYHVLDISCGTGSLMLQLLGLNYCVMGMDSSESMLRVASQKLRSVEELCGLWLGSMSDFAVQRKFDAVVCTYDSMNYCRESGLVAAALMNAARALNPGGLLIFDICTVRNSMRNFRYYYETESTEDFRYVRKSYYKVSRRIQINKFLISWKSDSGSNSFLEIHEQRIFRIEEMRGLIPAERYELVGIYDGFSLRPGSEKSDRVHFVLRRS